MKHRVTSWWWQPRRGINFGDELGAEVLRQMGYQVDWVPLADAQIFTTGTIMAAISDEARDGAILWGPGAGEDHLVNRFDVRALRGALTAEALGVEGIPLGDPGLLASRFWPRPAVRYGLGVVTHMHDRRRYPFADRIIRADRPPAVVIEEIGSCERIVSSSLHGLIVAASYGIPAMRAPHEGIISGDWKFADFLTSLGRPIEVIQDELIGAL